MTLSNKVLVTFKSLFLTIYYVIKIFVSKEVLPKSNNGFIVSLTSYGKRVRFSFLTIESIFNQSLKPSAIILWLYKEDQPVGIWLKILQRQISRGLTVRYVDRDVRSYKKLSFVLDDPFVVEGGLIKYIVTADDDVFYPYYWLDLFNEYYKKNKPAVLCYRGRNIMIENDNVITPYNTWTLATKETSILHNILPTGVSGICYPINSLDSAIYDFDMIDRLCPYADDIWYKMVTTKNSFNSEIVVDKSVHFTPVFTGFTKGLEKFNVINKLNDDQFIATMNYFKLSVGDFVKGRGGK